ncbi:hypothetical protein [Streptomyces lonarensis]|uniref:Uncharacterized protein n=1 Tax=Streptomyces lonarensis TaxID=700599 RepID=A0A7X6CZN1_9ACTN|nr:hypothetical protein [Streptomyces lonarensis]
MRCYWDEDDVWFYFEVDAEGWVTRQVELEEPELTPVVAASLAEWQRARDAGRLAGYDSRFGTTAEPPVSEWEGHDPEQLTSEEFDEVWVSARRHLAVTPR